LTKDELLRALDELCLVARNYGGLLDTLSSGEPAREVALARFNADRGRLSNAKEPETKTALLLALARHLLRRMEQTPLRFSLPSPIGEFAARDNPELMEYSPIAAKLAPVQDLADGLSRRGQDAHAMLLSAAHSLFKGVLRQDWDDVELMLAHINLTTSTRERHELVRRAQYLRLAQQLLRGGFLRKPDHDDRRIA
jgi:hypothetical protein